MYHFLLGLPIFAVVLMFLVIPGLQWLSVKLHHRKFVLRFGGALSSHDVNHRRDLFFSVVAFLVSLIVSYNLLGMLVDKGIL